MIENIQTLLEKHSFHVYEMALMTEEGLEEAVLRPSSRLHDTYSVTKLFINTVVGMLVEEGVLRLEDTLTSWLKPALTFPYDPRWDEVTLRQALGHTMGIDQGFFDVDRDDPASYQTLDYLAYIFSHTPSYAPGEHHCYTDVPHYLLSRVIEQATGRPADELVLERICGPLHFYPSAWQRCPWGHTIGATGAFLCARDLVKLGWLYQNEGEFQGKRLLTKNWVRLMEAERFDLYPMRQGDFVGKAGVNGQMLVYSRRHRLAIAWLGFEAREKQLRQVVLEGLLEMLES